MAGTGILQQADFRLLEQAVAFNHADLFAKEALTLGGSLCSAGALRWTSGGPASPSMIAFPQLTDQEAGDALDQLMEFYKNHQPAGAGCWSLEPAAPADLGVRLLARGFQIGWRPRWMALDMESLPTGHPSPKGLVIRADHTTDLRGVRDLPYTQVVIPSLSVLEREGQWMRFVARLNGKVVGQSVVFLTTGELGTAGIYHVGVLPKFRGQGIGKAVTLAACVYARAKGYRYAVLNATDAGQPTYERIGFSVMSEGWTWWLKMEKFLLRPPSAREVQLAEGLGRGDIPFLQRLRSGFSSDELDRQMTNGMSWMELAVHCRQSASAEWLLAEGAVCSILDAWDLGWKERAAELLSEDRERSNQLFGEWNKSLLHIAAERNDTQLAELILSASPDLQVRDSAYRSTPLEWAKHLGHADIVRLLEAVR